MRNGVIGSTADSDSVSRGSSPFSVAGNLRKAFSLFYRSVAQLGRALRSGRRGRRFKSCHSDFFMQKNNKMKKRITALSKAMILIFCSLIFPSDNQQFPAVSYHYLPGDYECFQISCLSTSLNFLHYRKVSTRLLKNCLNELRVQLDDLISCLDHCGDFNHKPDICRYGKAEFPARVLPHEMQMTDFLFWYYRGGSCSLKI